MFTCVKISASGDVSEIELSSKGGLEKDELQIFAKAYFGAIPLANHEIDRSKEELQEALKAAGTNPSKVSDSLMQHAGDIRVEIKTLFTPSPSNQYVGVSMYCDANASIRSHAIINQKATEIASKCGYKQQPVLGDVFISRLFDDEEKEWKRLNFTAEEVKLDAPWLLTAEKANSGRNMDSFSSSGVMSNMAGKTNKTMEDIDDGRFRWTQAKDEIEVRIKIPAAYTAKDCKVTIKPNHLHVLFPEFLGPSSEEERENNNKALSDLKRIQEGSGAELFDRILSAESSWSIEGTGENRFLTITAQKSVDGLRWLTLFR